MLTASVFFLPLAWDRRQPRDGPIRLRVPISYLFGVAAVIIVYIASILKLDAIVCEDVDTCNNYSKLEWSFSQSKAQETLSSWNRKQSSAMALSAGLHVFSSFLFAQLFIVSSVLMEATYRNMGNTSFERISGFVPFLARVFNVLYCAAHCTVASMIVSGNASQSSAVGASVILVFALILLVTCALYILVFGVVLGVTRKCCAPERDAALGGATAIVGVAPSSDKV